MLLAAASCAAPVEDGFQGDHGSAPDASGAGGARAGGSAMTGDGGADGGVRDDAAAGGSAAGGRPVPPDAAVERPPPPPVLIKPTPSARVFHGVDVEGTTVPSAAVLLRLLRGTAEIGRVRTRADEGGHFLTSLEYRGLSHGDALVLEAIVRNGAGSAMRRVDLEHYAPGTLTVAVRQAAGPSAAGEVHVRLYRNPNPEELPRWLDEQRFAVAAGELPEGRLVSFRVAPGSYVLRAFRDVAGPRGTADGQPTLGADPQSRALLVQGTSATVRAQVQLLAPAVPPGRYAGFNVMTLNESAQATPPSARDGVRRLVGRGYCGGYYLQLSVQREGDATSLGPPHVALPSLQTVVLRDDGACSPEVRDNRGSSYDDQAGDGAFRYGLPDPEPGDAGRYVLAYRDAASDQVHGETDELSAVRKLPILREPILPSPGETAADLRPTLAWQPVPGASAYAALLTDLARSWNNLEDPGLVVAAPTYRPAAALADDRCYALVVNAFDADPQRADVDAASIGAPHAFCVDRDRDDTVVVSGTLRNMTQQDVPVALRVTSDATGLRAATARVPAGQHDFRVALLRGDAAGAGQFEAFLDRAGSGVVSSLENEGYLTRGQRRDFTANATLDLVFNPPVVALSPAWFEAVPAQPRLRWRDYAETAGVARPAGAFSQVLWIGSEAGASAHAPAAFALPPDVQALDFASLPPPARRVDLAALLACVTAGGTFVTSAQGEPGCSGALLAPSATRFDSELLYVWTVLVIECDFARLTHPASTASDPFLRCLIDHLGRDEAYAYSAARPFVVAR